MRLATALVVDVGVGVAGLVVGVSWGGPGVGDGIVSWANRWQAPSVRTNAKAAKTIRFLCSVRRKTTGIPLDLEVQAYVQGGH